MKKNVVLNFLKTIDDDLSYMGHVMNAVYDQKMYQWDHDTYFRVKVGIDLWRVNKDLFEQYCRMIANEVAA